MAVHHRENQFHSAMRDLYHRQRSEFGVNASRFLEKLERVGGADYAREIVREDPTEGFVRALENLRLDLAVEALVVRPEWSDLFDEEDISLARDRLQQSGAPDWVVEGLDAPSG